MKNSFLALTLAGASASLVVLAAACSSSTTTSTPTPDAAAADTSTGADTGPAATPTFTDIYTDIIAVKCTPCHTTATGSGVVSGKLDMTTQAAAYTNLVGTAAAGEACNGMGTRVIAGDPDTSIMYLKASDDDPAPCGGKMPLGSKGLDADSSDEIKAWITAGAKP